MKIAYYEENEYHTEIMGTYLEYLSKNNIALTVYNTHDMSRTVSYFNKIYNFNVKPHTELIVDFKEYDKILIGTSSDTKDFIGKLKPLDINYEKLIFVCHLGEDIRQQYKNIIVVSPLNLKLHFNPHIKYMLPIHNNIPCIKNIAKSNLLTIVGRFKKPHRDANDLVKLITQYSTLNYQIRLFARKTKFVPEEISKLAMTHPKRIRISLRSSTDELDVWLKKSKYILPLITKDSWYHKDRLSGSIALAYNYNIPMIVDKRTSEIYNLKGCVTYDNSITDVIKNVIEMSDSEYQKMVQTFVESKIKIIQNNNNILDTIFQLK